MADTMQVTRSRASWYWCGEPYNNMVLGNTGTLIIKEGGRQNVSGNYETQSAGIYEFDLSSVPENRVVTGLTVNIPVTTINDVEGPVTPDTLGGTPNILYVWRCTKYDLSDFTNKSHAKLVEMKSPYDGYSILTDYEDATTFNASSYLYSQVSLRINQVSLSNDKKIYICVNRNNSYSQNYDIFLGAATLTVTYDVIVPNPPTDLVPNGGNRNKAGEIKLAWTYLDSALGTLQSKYDVLYSTDNFATSKSISKQTSDNFAIIPANTFTEGQQVKWRVRAYNSFGDPSEYSFIALFDIGPTPPEKPEPLKPVSVVNSSDPVIFGWKYMDTYQGSQAGYELEYKKLEQVKTASGGAESYYTLASGVLEGGDYLWRVRTKNQYGELSPWCDWTAFYSIGEPDKPVITGITNHCRPIVTWTVTEQDAWELQILQGDKIKYTTGMQPDTAENRYQVPEFLSNGNYVASLKVRNVYGIWSKEAKQAFAIEVTAPEKPEITVSQMEESVIIQIASGAETNLLYREMGGETKVIPLDGKEYVDFTVTGSYRYFVRAVSQDAFYDSDVVAGRLTFDGVTLARADHPENCIRLKMSFGEDKRKTANPTNDVHTLQCNGRVYPIAQTSGFKTYVETHEYFLDAQRYEQFKQIREGDLFLIRDGDGLAFYAVMTNCNIQQNQFGQIIGFTLERVEV